jgi:metal-responsive CopG/Arc/MetJ family transcriptional regulator
MTTVVKVAISLPEDLAGYVETERVRRGVGRSEVIADALRAAKKATEEAARAAGRIGAAEHLHGLLATPDQSAGTEETR